MKKRAKYTLFRPRIRSRHPSHKELRPVFKSLPLLPFRSLIRFGSFTKLVKNTRDRIELNTIKAITNSSNKLLMKKCFTENNVNTANWWVYVNNQFLNNSVTGEQPITDITELPYPIISKHINGSRGRGNKKHDTAEQLQAWLNTKTNFSNYIFEKFYNYNREYRLHVSRNGCFYTCRKMIKRETPDNQRWYRNDNNSIWVLEDNELFDKPINWDEIVNHSVNALKSVGLDFGAVDLRVQSSTKNNGQKRTQCKFIVVEINSAPSFGSVTKEKYIEELPKLLKQKYQLSHE